MDRPQIIHYQDYRAFLKDWMQFLGFQDSTLTLEKLAEKSGVALGCFQKFFEKSVGLTSTTLGKIIPYLALTQYEKNYLKLLRTIAESEDSAERVQALEKLKTTHASKPEGDFNFDDYQYMSHWYYVAIREMASLPDFQMSAEWIQSKLHFEVSIEDLSEALVYLKQKGLIEIDVEGKARATEKHLDCTGGLYRLSLAQFHEQMLALAQESITKTARQDRKMLSHTVAIPQNRVAEAKAILEDAWQRVAELSSTFQRADSVYHLELALFPLTTPEKKRMRYERS